MRTPLEPPVTSPAIPSRLTLLLRRFAADPNFKAKTLVELNSEAVRFLKTGDDMRCIGAFAKLFCKLRENNLTHKELYVAHSNRAAAYLNLGLYEEALWDARRCATLAEAQFARSHERSAVPSFVKSFQRKARYAQHAPACRIPALPEPPRLAAASLVLKMYESMTDRRQPVAPLVAAIFLSHQGFALLGLGLARQAKVAFEEGLKYDPFSEELKRGIEEATQSLLGELLNGGGREQLSLPAPGRAQERIALLPHSAPLHVVHASDALPVRLLSPQQAESDHHVKDTYNYLTISADIRLPERHVAYLADTRRVAAFEKGVARACAAVAERGCDVRVLHLGPGAGLLSLLALRHGAHHVTAADRWLYLAMATKESLRSNGVADDRASVIYKRPTDLILGADVPVSCNVLLLDGLLDDGLLSAGLLPAIQHAREKLLVLPDCVVVPGSATVFVQAVELRSTDVLGFDCSAANLFRWHPSHTSGLAQGTTNTPTSARGTGGGEGACVPLSDPVVAFHFDLRDPPGSSDSRVVELPFIRDGQWNAVAFWFELTLADGVVLSSRGRLAPRSGASGASGAGATTDSGPTCCDTLQAAVQYLPGEIPVEGGRAAPLRCSHNTVRMVFSVDEAEYSHLYKTDAASFPQGTFAMLADEGRARAYQAAIERQVTRCRARSGAWWPSDWPPHAAGAKPAHLLLLKHRRRQLRPLRGNSQRCVLNPCGAFCSLLLLHPQHGITFPPHSHTLLSPRLCPPLLSVCPRIQARCTSWTSVRAPASSQ